jgi:hypothetical protein
LDLYGSLGSHQGGRVSVKPLLCIARFTTKQRNTRADERTRSVDLISSEEDLDALADALEDGIATFKDPYRVSSERFRRPVDALLECIEVLREGKEPPSAFRRADEENPQWLSHLEL